jgi:uncharacterized protein YpmB
MKKIIIVTTLVCVAFLVSAFGYVLTRPDEAQTTTSKSSQQAKAPQETTLTGKLIAVYEQGRPKSDAGNDLFRPGLQMEDGKVYVLWSDVEIKAITEGLSKTDPTVEVTGVSRENSKWSNVAFESRIDGMFHVDSARIIESQ